MKKIYLLLFPFFVIFVCSAVQAQVQSRTVEYRDGETILRGHLAWDDALTGERPGVIVVHEWWGLNDYARHRAEQLASRGYVAFAVDMYGADRVTQHGKQAGEWMRQITENVDAWQRRALLGLDVLRKDPHVDPSRVAAIGYCFGGATVMQMAYAGADLKGVVSFHGSLPVLREGQAGNVKARILVVHGYDDTFVPPERVSAFQTALDQAGADWQMLIYGGTRHGFTNPDAASYGIDNLRYNPAADRRSWQAMMDFFSEIFAPAE